MAQFSNGRDRAHTNTRKRYVSCRYLTPMRNCRALLKSLDFMILLQSPSVETKQPDWLRKWQKFSFASYTTKYKKKLEKLFIKHKAEFKQKIFKKSLLIDSHIGKKKRHKEKVKKKAKVKRYVR